MRIPKRLMGLAAVGMAGALAITACSPPGDDDTGDDTAADLGWEGCEDNPDTCHTGPVEDGGEFTMMISLPFEAWSQLRSAGNSVYTLQAVEGIFPNNSHYAPSGEWVWDEEFYEEVPTITNEDPLTFTYRIKEEAVWSDGEPITARDVQYIWYNSSGNPDHCDGCEPPSTADWGLVDSVEGSDGGKTVTITLKEGENNPEWQPAYTTGGYPAHLADAAGYDWENDPAAMGESTVWFSETMPDWSGGPWILESGTLTETVVKVPNENYWGEQPNLDKIIGEVVNDPGTWIPALTNGDIDGGSPATFDVDVFRELETVDNIEYGAGSAGSVWEHIDVNLEHEYLADIELRKAIFTAIDMEHAATSIWGDDVPVNQRLNITFSQLSPNFEDHRTPTGFGSGDAEAARGILEAAGYTGFEEGGTLTTPDGDEVPPIRFRWTAGNTNRASTGELVQEYASRIGVTIELDDSEDLGGMLVSGDYDLVIFGWSGSPRFVGGLTQLWTSESGSNFNSINNQEIDDLAAEAARQTSLEDAAVIANQLDEVLVNEAVVLPMWDSPAFDFISADYVNMRPNHNSSARLWYNQQEWGVLAAE